MKLLLLCAVPKVTEWKKCSERVRKNDCNEVNGGTGTLFENFNGVGKGKCYDEMSGSTLAQGDLTKCRSYSCGIPEASEYRKRGTKDRSEEAEGTGALIGNLSTIIEDKYIFLIQKEKVFNDFNANIHIRWRVVSIVKWNRYITGQLVLSGEIKKKWENLGKLILSFLDSLFLKR